MNRGFSRSNLALGPLVGGLHEDFSDEFVEAEDEEHEGAEDVEVLLVLDAFSEHGGAEASEADGEELGKDSTDNDGLEAVRRRHGDGDNLGLVTHFSGDEHEGEEDISRPLSNLAAAQESLELGANESLFLVCIMLMCVDAVFVSLGMLNCGSNVFISSTLARDGSLPFDLGGDGPRLSLSRSDWCSFSFLFKLSYFYVISAAFLTSAVRLRVIIRIVFRIVIVGSGSLIAVSVFISR